MNFQVNIKSGIELYITSLTQAVNIVNKYFYHLV